MADPPVIAKSIAQGMSLYTHTPVLSINPSDTPSHPWTLITSRGPLLSKSIIIATNAYTSGILPEFKTKIIPVRGTACSITPSPSHSLGGLPGPLKYTYGIRFGAGESDYMIPRQGRRMAGLGDKSLVLGGAKGCFLGKREEWYDNIRDDEEMPGARRYFEEYMGKHFVGWDGDEGNVDHVWSGGGLGFDLRETMLISSSGVLVGSVTVCWRTS
jgi:glycine/D-amino acid oxidase-like deaminating enzyme